MEYDVAIIGSGMSGTMAALRAIEKYKNAKIIVFEIGKKWGKRRRQLEGFLGAFPFSDGKIYENLSLDKDILNWVNEYFKAAGPMKLNKDPGPSSSAKKILSENGWKIKLNNYFQWKPEYIHQLSKLIANKFEKSDLTFKFDTEVEFINKEENFILTTAKKETFFAKNVIVASGKSGWRWVTELYKNIGLKTNDDYATFGVRIEAPSSFMKEYKCHSILTKDQLTVGPFNWFGSIIPEDHADLVISSFRSNEDRWKTDKVSFEFNKTIKFENQGVYQSDRIGKLSLILFNDKVSKERIRLFIKNKSQLNLLKEYNWMHSALQELDKIMPEISLKGNLCVPNIVPIPAKINLTDVFKTEIDGLYVVGENTGNNDILFAACSGITAIDNILG